MARESFAWLEKLYNDQYKTVYKLIKRRLVGYPSEDIDDIIQEVFLLAWEKDIHDHPKPVAWLITTANNLCLNYIHSNWRQQKKTSALEQQHLIRQRVARPIDSAVKSEADAVDLMVTLRAELSPQDLWLLEEYCFKDTSIEELSRRTGLSVSGIRVRIHRIRKHIVKLLPIFIFCLEVFHDRFI